MLTEPQKVSELQATLGALIAACASGSFFSIVPGGREIRIPWSELEIPSSEREIWFKHDIGTEELRIHVGNGEVFGTMTRRKDKR